MPTFPELDKNFKLREKLRELFNLRQQGQRDPSPLGPIDAAHIDDPQVAAALYDVENSSFHDLLAGRSLIVGRRGAGKSALLRTYKQRELLMSRIAHSRLSSHRNDPFESTKKYDFIVEVLSAKKFEDMQSEINKKYDPGVEPAVETLSGHWRHQLWILVLKELFQAYRDRYVSDASFSLIVDFVGQAFNIRQQEAVRGLALGRISGALPVLNDFQEHLEKAIAAATIFIKEHNLKGIILFDSMEEYPLLTRPLARAMKGILRCIWEHFNQAALSSNLQIKFVIPSEIYNS
jgi:hypothetical protein